MMNRKLQAAMRGSLPALVCLVLGACHTDPATEATAQNDRLQACMAQSVTDQPNLSHGERQTYCRKQVGRAAFEVPAAAVPAPVH